ncbi:hypothetical protein [Glycomyces tarimensis]
MSPDTAAKRPDSAAAQRPHGRGAGEAGPNDEHHEHGEPERRARMWTYLTLAAAAAFLGTLVLVATSLFVNVTEVSDTPERSVEEFLGALLDEQNPEAASRWLCEAKADRDLTEATAVLADAGEQNGLGWSDVTETGRSVGGATVTAELTGDGGDAATWTFTLIAEQGDPQWQVCGMAVG